MQITAVTSMTSMTSMTPLTPLKVQDSAPIMNMVKNTRLTFTLGEALYLRYHRENGMFRRREDA